MVETRIIEDRLELEFLGLSKLWAFRSRLEIPLAVIKSVHIGEPIPKGFYFRVLGTGFPGAISAGIFTDFKRWAFFDLRAAPSNAVVLEPAGWKYDVVAVEVKDAPSTAELIRAAIASLLSSGATPEVP
jgi:hypothetical protein